MPLCANRPEARRVRRPERKFGHAQALLILPAPDRAPALEPHGELRRQDSEVSLPEARGLGAPGLARRPHLQARGADLAVAAL